MRILIDHVEEFTGEMATYLNEVSRGIITGETWGLGWELQVKDNLHEENSEADGLEG